ncbi:hypothetical protein [Glutamicibacter sp. NPDC087344]|uniref:hypothetical protein n=1 Tax=Glutamicibacter sp. NPDC087344 TaxID=3363994 RepID=UPI0038208480
MSIAPEPFEISVVSLSPQEVVEKALEFLPASLVASTAGVQDPGQVRKWKSGKLTPTFPTLERLRFMLTKALQITEVESAAVATSWLTSASSRLNYDLPIKAIRESRYREVSEAASFFLDGYAG